MHAQQQISTNLSTHLNQPSTWTINQYLIQMYCSPHDDGDDDDAV